MDHALSMGEWEQQRCASRVMNAGPDAVIWVLNVIRSLILRCGGLDSRSGR